VRENNGVGVVDTRLEEQVEVVEGLGEWSGGHVDVALHEELSAGEGREGAFGCRGKKGVGGWRERGFWSFWPHNFLSSAEIVNVVRKYQCPFFIGPTHHIVGIVYSTIVDNMLPLATHVELIIIDGY
jgi:hypothetical protein